VKQTDLNEDKKQKLSENQAI